MVVALVQQQVQVPVQAQAVPVAAVVGGGAVLPAPPLRLPLLQARCV
jgi:hypothetical protein